MRWLIHIEIICIISVFIHYSKHLLTIQKTNFNNAMITQHQPECKYWYYFPEKQEEVIYNQAD